MEEISSNEFPCEEYLTVQTEALEQMFYGESPTVYMHDGQYFLATNSQMILLNSENAQFTTNSIDDGNNKEDSSSNQIQIYDSEQNTNTDCSNQSNEDEIYELHLDDGEQQNSGEDENTHFLQTTETESKNELQGDKDINQFICVNTLNNQNELIPINDIQEGNQYVQIKGADNNTRLIKINRENNNQFLQFNEESQYVQIAEGHGFIQENDLNNEDSNNLIEIKRENNLVLLNESELESRNSLITVNVLNRETDDHQKNLLNVEENMLLKQNTLVPISENYLIPISKQDLNNGYNYTEVKENKLNAVDNLIHVTENNFDVDASNIQVTPETDAGEYGILTNFQVNVKNEYQIMSNGITSKIDKNKYHLIDLNNFEGINSNGHYEIISMNNFENIKIEQNDVEDNIPLVEEAVENSLKEDDLANLVVGKNLVTGKTVTLHKYLEKIRKGKRKLRKDEEPGLPIKSYSVGKMIYKIMDIRKNKKMPEEYIEIVSKTLTSLMDMESIRKRFENNPLIIKVNEMEGENQVVKGEVNGFMMKSESEEWTFINFRDNNHKDIIDQAKIKFRCQNHICATIILSRYMGKLKTIKVHQNTEQKPYVCIVCFKEFNSTKALFKHYSTHNEPYLRNPMPSTTYTCLMCHKPFTSKTSFKRHQAIHDESFKNLECSTCLQKFVDLTTLKRHLLFHTGIKVHRCEICDKSFTLMGDLNVHRKTHFGIFKCEVCGRKFSRQGNMLRHATIHNGEHKCRICGSSYHHISTLTRHMMKEHVEVIKS